VSECRCGFIRPEDPRVEADDDDAVPPSSRVGALLKGVAWLALLGVSVAWFRVSAPQPNQAPKRLFHRAAAPAAPAAPVPAEQPMPPATQPVANTPFQPGVAQPPGRRSVVNSWPAVPTGVPDFGPRITSPSRPPERRSDAEPLSEVDRRRIEGLLKLQQAYSAILGQAMSLVRMGDLYDQNCASNQVDERCVQLRHDMARSAVFVAVGLDHAEEICRTHWLEPGVARDAREALGLDDQIWDEILRAVRNHR
jgi:hypothetical protein